MTILYDALGRKWSKTGESGTVYYIDGFEFRNGQLEAVYAPDGRLVPDEGASGPLSIDLRAEYWRQDHLGNTRVTFSDFNQNGRVDVVDDPTTIENELEITQESHYYPFGLRQNGDWYETVAPENKYLYNGKELSEDYGIDLYAYGFRYYDPAIGRFTGVDPIADEFAWVSTYNYAENEPVAHIDLHGLQKVLAITQIGTNSKGENFSIRSTEINKPPKGVYNHLYSSYANPNKYGDKGKLEVLHHVDKGIFVEKYTQEKSFMGRLADLFDGEVNGGIQFSLSFGQGKEERSSQSAEVGSSLDDLMSAFGVASTTTGMPVSNHEDIARFIFSAFQNTTDVFSAMKQDKSKNKTTKEPADSVCNTCTRSPHGLPYRTIDSEGNSIDTINPSEEKRNQ